MWKKGPVPLHLWGWGRVVIVSREAGFFFADFRGDYVRLIPSDQAVPLHEIAWYEYSTEVPAGVDSRRLCER